MLPASISPLPGRPACPFVSRRRFLKIGGLAATGLLLPRYLLARKEDLLRISIFHTTDLHAHILPTESYEGVGNLGGFARIARQLRRWKTRYPHHLLLDGGDLYQGTPLGHATEGEIMIRCLNHLDYDGWVAGNHEFDWGIDPFRRAVNGSSMPVMAANVRIDGHEPQPEGDPNNGFSNLRPCMVKEVAGVRVGVVGLITTGMPQWFPPELTRGFTFLDPLAPTRNALRWLREEGRCDLVVLVCHMGIRRQRIQDDHANHVVALTREFPEISAVIGAHTHQDIPHETVNGIPYTQASYHGIHLGRLDFFLDPETRRLLHVEPITERMHPAIGEDAAVLALVAPELEAVQTQLDRVIGTLAHPLRSTRSAPGKPSDLELFTGQYLMERLEHHGHAVDAIYHGTFLRGETIPSGPLTIRDMWRIMPFENYLVLADLLPAQLEILFNENLAGGGHRSLMGLAVHTRGEGNRARVADIRRPDGAPIGAEERITVAVNSYDSASGGNRLPMLRELFARQDVNRRILPYQTRVLLTEYIETHGRVALRQPSVTPAPASP
jgi:2',3'-cyclic-nucleotide 2'-phosphodiesterase (5'-nucleotidase family)